MSALEDSDWYVGALIRDADGNPTWKYRTEPFQQAVAADGRTLVDLEEACGWKNRKGGYLNRVLGMRPRQTSMRNGRRYGGGTSTSLSYAQAVRIARALDLDFVRWEL